MANLPGEYLFAEYAALLERRLALQTETQTGGVESTTTSIADVDGRIALLERCPDLAESALQYGTVLAGYVQAQVHTEVLAASTKEIQRLSECRKRLGQVAAFATERGMEDERLRDITETVTLLGVMATQREVDMYGGEAVAPLEVFEPEIAMKRLRSYIKSLGPGQTSELTAQGVVDIAAPHAYISRWQRYRFVQRARKILHEEGYVFEHNSKRGIASRYVIGGKETGYYWLVAA